VPDLGVHHLEISLEELNNLTQLLEKQHFTSYQKEYLKPIADLPKIKIAYKGYEIIFHRKQGPKLLDTLRVMLEKIHPASSVAKPL